MRCEAGSTVSSGSSLSADVEGALAAEHLLSTLFVLFTGD
jgi:hypothetical protein